VAHGQHQERGDLCFHLVGRALPDRESAPEEESMSAWKNRVVVLTMILLGVSLANCSFDSL